MALDSYTKLLMHMDDSSFIDVCGNTVTNNGATLDTTTKKFGNGSAYLSGTTATYLIAILDALNTTYTIDFWFNLRNNNGTNIFFTTNNVASTNASTTRCFGYKNGNFVIISNTDSQYYSFGAYSININQWYHCAYEWDGSNTTIYINGSNIKSVASNYLLRYFIKIGIDYYNYHYFNGNIDELRISNIARWTTDFTQPTHNKLLIQSPSQTIDKNNFINNEISNIAKVSNSIWSNTFPNITHARILCYTDDNTITENDLVCDITPYRPIDDLQNKFDIKLFKDS